MKLNSWINLLAALALLAVPVLHGWHTAGHWAAACQEAPDFHVQGFALSANEDRPAGHDGLACSICQGISHARNSVVPAVHAVPLAALGLALRTAGRAESNARAPDVSSVSPRGPPPAA